MNHDSQEVRLHAVWPHPVGTDVVPGLGIATFRAAGYVANFPGLWTSAWLTAWMVAFPVVLVVAPFARQMVELVIRKR